MLPFGLTEEEVLKWLAGTFVASVCAVAAAAFRGGKEKAKYEEVVAKVELHDAVMKSFITDTAHIDMQKQCQQTIMQTISSTKSTLEHQMDNRINMAIIDFQHEISFLNANICKLLGAQQIEPVQRFDRRRRSDDLPGLE